MKPEPAAYFVGAASEEFRVVLTDSNLELETLCLASEEDLVTALRSTYQIKAPVEVTYSDGSSIKGDVMERIHRKVFALSQSLG